MPTYTNTTKVSSGVPVKAGTDIISVTGSYTVAVALVTNDIIEMVKLPKGVTVQEVIFSSSASVGGTANLTIGDTGDADRFITSTAFTAAALARLNAHTGHGFVTTADTTISVTAASIATGTTGTVLTLTVIYTTNP